MVNINRVVGHQVVGGLQVFERLSCVGRHIQAGTAEMSLRKRLGNGEGRLSAQDSRPGRDCAVIVVTREGFHALFALSWAGLRSGRCLRFGEFALRNTSGLAVLFLLTHESTL